MYRDQYGSPLQEGDFVAFPIALGNVVRGQVVKLDSGLALGGPNQPSQSIAHIAIVLDLQAAPNGVVAGIVKVAQPADAPKLQAEQPAQPAIATVEV